MDVHLCGTTWVIHAPAKLNLFFEVLGRREDGYHLVETFVSPVSLYDTLTVRETEDDQIILRVQLITGEWAPEALGFATVPTDASNLVYRAAQLLRQETGISRGAEIQLIKRIPTGAGLGGGSADAAAALLGLARLWNLHIPPDQLLTWATRLGSDVPLFLERGPCVCRGRGEQIEQINQFTRLDAVVIKPRVSLSTADVYRACRVPDVPATVQPMLRWWTKGNWRQLGGGLFNRLEEAATMLAPQLREVRSALESSGCSGVSMTGSGSCYFGLFRHRKQALAAARRLAARNLGAVFVVHTVA